MKLLDIFDHALMITSFVFVMMLLVDFVDLASKRRISNIIRESRWRQYVLTSFLGATPGCLGAFTNVSLYIHGMISFGAVVGGMIATSGDEAFVMLAQFPGTAFVLFCMLFIMGIIFAAVSDKIIPLLGIAPREVCLEHHCEQCLSVSGMDDTKATENLFNPRQAFANLRSISFTRFLLLALIGLILVLSLSGKMGPGTWNWIRITFVALSFCSFYIALVASEHYLHEHIWDHIIKKHLLQVFLWSLGALIVVHWGLAFFDLDAFVHEHGMWVLLLGALIGLIPASGPHLVFVMMYAQDLIPFSALFTISFVQDGHGMLPLLSYSLKDALMVKLLNLVFGLGVGFLLFAFGF